MLEKAKEAREIFFLTKGLGPYRQATGKSSGFQGESKYKENVAKHVFSTNDSYRESEEFSSMGKQLVLCKNSSKLADSRKVKTFFRGMGDAYKATKILEIVKEFKIPFLECSVREKISQTRHMGQEDMRTEHAKEGSHTRDRASDW